MKKNLLFVLVIFFSFLCITGCNNDVQNKNESSNTEQNSTDKAKNNDTDKTNDNDGNNNEKDAFYVGTYYMVLTDGSLAEDGTGTIILNQDMTCTYIYGQSNIGCTSYSVNDHVITLKVSEQSSDVILVLEADHKFLIDANNEKYMRK